MGYDLHITRADDWTDSESNPITLAEWTRLVSADPEMHLAPAATVRADDEDDLTCKSEGVAVWTGHPVRTSASDPVWFDFRRGRIVVKNPDEQIIEKMVAIGQALNARVQGDDGEYYGEKDVPQFKPPPPPRPRPWWKRVLGG